MPYINLTGKLYIYNDFKMGDWNKYDNRPWTNVQKNILAIDKQFHTSEIGTLFNLFCETQDTRLASMLFDSINYCGEKILENANYYTTAYFADASKYLCEQANNVNMANPKYAENKFKFLKGAYCMISLAEESAIRTDSEELGNIIGRKEKITEEYNKYFDKVAEKQNQKHK